jgi:predicted nucleic-acid-binding protein
VKIVADTNVLVRAITDDDPKQSRSARTALQNADLVAIGNATLCELVWVLIRPYRTSASDVARAVRGLIDSANVAVDRAAVDAGLAQLDRGGDFADGVIAFEGLRLGGDVFLSFDRTAVRLVEAAGGNAKLL